MLGWFKAEAALASRWKRLRACGSCGNVIGQELESDETAKFHVFGFVDHTHTAAAKLLDNAVVRNGLADQYLSYQSLFCQSRSSPLREHISRVGRVNALLIQPAKWKQTWQKLPAYCPEICRIRGRRRESQ